MVGEDAVGAGNRPKRQSAPPSVKCVKAGCDVGKTCAHWAVAMAAREAVAYTEVGAGR